MVARISVVLFFCWYKYPFLERHAERQEMRRDAVTEHQRIQLVCLYAISGEQNSKAHRLFDARFVGIQRALVMTTAVTLVVRLVKPAPNCARLLGGLYLQNG